MPVREVSNGAVTILYEAGVGNFTLHERLGRRLEQAIADNPSELSLRFDLANLRCLQERNDDAEAIYRDLFNRNKGLGGPLNNLAFLLALRGGTKVNEAFTLIGKAVEPRGRDARPPGYARDRLPRHEPHRPGRPRPRGRDRCQPDTGKISSPCPGLFRRGPQARCRACPPRGRGSGPDGEVSPSPGAGRLSRGNSGSASSPGVRTPPPPSPCSHSSARRPARRAIDPGVARFSPRPPATSTRKRREAAGDRSRRPARPSSAGRAGHDSTGCGRSGTCHASG